MADGTPLAAHGTVLIVDDEAFIARAVACILVQLRGTHVRVAGNGDEALRLAGELRPDLILVDVNMPGTSCRALCERLRALEPRRHTPLYLFTGLLPDAATIAPLLGLCDGLISKPPDPAELLAALDGALHGRAAA